MYCLHSCLEISQISLWLLLLNQLHSVTAEAKMEGETYMGFTLISLLSPRNKHHKAPKASSVCSGKPPTTWQCSSSCFGRRCRKMLTHLNKFSGEIKYCTCSRGHPGHWFPHANLRRAQRHFHLHWGRGATENPVHQHNLAQIYLVLKKKRWLKKKSKQKSSIFTPQFTAVQVLPEVWGFLFKFSI